MVLLLLMHTTLEAPKLFPCFLFLFAIFVMLFYNEYIYKTDYIVVI